MNPTKAITRLKDAKAYANEAGLVMTHADFLRDVAVLIDRYDDALRLIADGPLVHNRNPADIAQEALRCE